MLKLKSNRCGICRYEILIYQHAIGDRRFGHNFPLTVSAGKNSEWCFHYYPWCFQIL